MSDLDDEIRKRQLDRQMLEGDDTPFRKSRPSKDDLIDPFVDDLELADQIAGATGLPTSGIEHKLSLRDQKWKNLVDVAPFARSNPPTILQGTLGGQQPVANGAGFVWPTGSSTILPRKAQVAFWGGDDAETHPISVTFAPVQQIGDTPADAALGLNFLPYGIVQFGTRGFLVKAEVDIGTGVQFTVTGSQATLEVALDDPPNIATELGVGAMLLSGMLSFLPVIRTTNITRTLRADNVNQAAVATFDIPAFARSVFIYPSVYTTGFVASVRNSQTGLIYNYNHVAGGSVMFQPLPLSGDAVRLDVVPGAASTRITCVFNLAF